MSRTLGIAGLGAVGRAVAERVAADLSGYTLTAVTARRHDRARSFLDELGLSSAVVRPEEVAQRADVVVECAPPSLFRLIAEPVVSRGGTLVALSAGALLDSWDLVDEAERTGATIRVPSGALLGLDAVQGAAQGRVESVTMVTRKPAAGLSKAPLVVEQGLDLESIAEPLQVFAGTAREAIARFPANLNVAVALSLAGIGPDRTMLEVWADPALDRNTHRVIVRADSADLDFSVSNVPTENPATGRLTALSVIALLKKMSSALQVGT